MNEETQTQVSEWEIKAGEYLAGWQRTQADLANYRRDEAKRFEEVRQFGNERLITDFLDLADNLTRAVAEAPESVRQQSEWFAGLTKVVDSFEHFLNRAGVERIATAGAAFDPLLHEAVRVVPQPETEATADETATGQRVLEEYRPGYTLAGKVIRPARVKISQ